MGGIGTFGAVFTGGAEFMNNFGLFLNMISYYVAPYLTVIFIDYFLARP